MGDGTPPGHAGEIASGKRFEFGENWRDFLARLDEKRIHEAHRSLGELLGNDSLRGKRFLDIGSGSGLFSLAAMRWGAERVCSFDYDPQSVACTSELRRRYFPDDPRWTVIEGSVLDEAFLASLGKHDVVYAWGVLHHTGDMWRAIGNALSLVKPGGQIALAIYNDQGWKSKIWLRVKKLYCLTPGPMRSVLFLPIPLFYEMKWMIGDFIRGKVPFAKWRKRSGRGMNPWHDWIDWLGGYPFEVAKPEEVFEFFRDRGFQLTKLVTSQGGWGNNEFVFRSPETGGAESA